jgi:hypothetical protein
MYITHFSAAFSAKQFRRMLISYAAGIADRRE